MAVLAGSGNSPSVLLAELLLLGVGGTVCLCAR